MSLAHAMETEDRLFATECSSILGSTVNPSAFETGELEINSVGMPENSVENVQQAWSTAVNILQCAVQVFLNKFFSKKKVNIPANAPKILQVVLRKKRIASFLKLIPNIMADVDTRISRNKENYSESVALLGRINTEQKNATDSRDRFNSRMADYEVRRNTLQAELKELQKKAESLKKSLEAIKGKNKCKKKPAEETTTQDVQDLSSEMSTVKSKSREKMDEITRVSADIASCQAERDVQDAQCRDIASRMAQLNFEMNLEQFLICFRSGQRVVIRVIEAFFSKVLNRLIEVEADVDAQMKKLLQEGFAFQNGPEFFKAGLLEYYIQTRIIQEFSVGKNSLLYTAYETVFCGHPKVDVQVVFSFAFLTIVSTAGLSDFVSKHTRTYDFLSPITLELEYILQKHIPVFPIPYLQRIVENQTLFQLSDSDLITPLEMPLDPQMKERCNLINDLYKLPVICDFALLDNLDLPPYREYMNYAFEPQVFNYLKLEPLSALSCVVYGNTEFWDSISEDLKNYLEKINNCRKGMEPFDLDQILRHARSEVQKVKEGQLQTLDFNVNSSEKKGRGRTPSKPILKYSLLDQLTMDGFLGTKMDISPQHFMELWDPQTRTVDQELLGLINAGHFKRLDAIISNIHHPEKRPLNSNDEFIMIHPITVHYEDALKHFGILSDAKKTESGRPSKRNIVVKHEHKRAPSDVRMIESVKQEPIDSFFLSEGLLGKRKRFENYNDDMGSSSFSNYNPAKKQKVSLSDKGKQPHSSELEDGSSDDEDSLEFNQTRFQSDASIQQQSLLMANVLQTNKSNNALLYRLVETVNALVGQINTLTKQYNDDKRHYHKRSPRKNNKLSPMGEQRPSFINSSAASGSSCSLASTPVLHSNPYNQFHQIPIKEEHFMPPTTGAGSFVGSVAVAHWNDGNFYDNLLDDADLIISESTGQNSVIPTPLQFSAAENLLGNSTAFDVNTSHGDVVIVNAPVPEAVAHSEPETVHSVESESKKHNLKEKTSQPGERRSSTRTKRPATQKRFYGNQQCL